MRGIAAVLACVAGLASTAAPAAAQSRKTAGVVSLLAGAGLVAAAFDYRADVCPTGYSTHTYEDLPTQCSFVSAVPPYDTDVRNATTEATYKRPALAWAGVGAAGLGVVLLMLPDNPVTRRLDVRVSPEQVSVRRKFGW